MKVRNVATCNLVCTKARDTAGSTTHAHGAASHPPPPRLQPPRSTSSPADPAHNFFGLKTRYNVASISPSVVKVPPMMAHRLVR